MMSKLTKQEACDILNRAQFDHDFNVEGTATKNDPRNKPYVCECGHLETATTKSRIIQVARKLRANHKEARQ